MNKKRSKYLLFFVLIIGLISCSQKTKTAKDSSLPAKEKSNEISKYSSYQKMLAIDSSLDKTHKVVSLRWEKQTKQYGSTFTSVQAYIDDDGIPVKITKFFHDGEFQPEGEEDFYLENNKVIYWTEKKDSWIDSNQTKYSEKRTLYKNNNPILSEERETGDYEHIDTTLWKKIPTNHPSIEEARNILKGEGHFKLHFISVIQSNQLFLLLGENKPNTDERYITTVRVDNITPFIQDLLAHLKKYKFRPVAIKFKVVGGENQPVYRVLTDMKWVK